jgi:methyl-accepting chemotaxis protein
MPPDSPAAALDKKEILAALKRLQAGDLTVQLPEGSGDATDAEIAATFNAHVETLNQFAFELTRVSREMGTEGVLGGSMKVSGAQGTWKDLADNVNTMTATLTVQLRSLFLVVTRLSEGDFSVRITVNAAGETAQLRDEVNVLADRLHTLAGGLSRLSDEIGTQGRYGGQIELNGATGTWVRLVADVNRMSENLANQLRAAFHVTAAVAQGDISQIIPGEPSGEMGEFARTVNAMVRQLSVFADELVRIAREIGVEGKFGGQMEVPGLPPTGTWRDITDSVNRMSANLTDQIRDVSQTAQAALENGPPRPTSAPAQGEMRQLFEHIDALSGKGTSGAE